MDVLLQDKRKLIVISLFLITLFAFAYMSFEKYQPKILRKIEEVKGIRKTTESDLPLPGGSTKVGFNRTSESTQTTFQTEKNVEEVLKFYKNVFKEREWVLESETTTQNSSICKFKKSDKLITIISSRQEDASYTVVSIEETKR